MLQQTPGQRGHARTLLAGAPQLNAGRLLYDLALFHNDGPWRVAPRTQLALDVHNLLKRHVHPGEPRTLRMTLTHRY
jgi:hypothetical protein